MAINEGAYWERVNISVVLPIPSKFEIALWERSSLVSSIQGLWKGKCRGVSDRGQTSIFQCTVPVLNAERSKLGRQVVVT